MLKAHRLLYYCLRVMKKEKEDRAPGAQRPQSRPAPQHQTVGACLFVCAPRRITRRILELRAVQFSIQDKTVSQRCELFKAGDPELENLGPVDPEHEALADVLGGAGSERLVQDHLRSDGADSPPLH